MHLRRRIALGLAGVALAGTAGLALLAGQTDAEIEAQRAALRQRAAATPAPAASPADLQALPAPVQRWVRHTFRRPPAAGCWEQVDVEMAGRFRRPRSKSFADTQARLLAATGTPALVFDARTTLLPGLWARAYDAYVDGHMTMKAQILSALPVVNEASTPALDRQSLRRWLLESAFYPAALLPGGAVRWQALDDRHARAVATQGAVQASLRATFGDDGRLLQMDAEDDGDLAAPYHGSGEQVRRDDEREVDGVMIPHGFVVARVAAGRVWPFWDGHVTALHPTPAGTCPTNGRQAAWAGVNPRRSRE